MAKNKYSKIDKQKRKQKEILRAQVNTNARGQFTGELLEAKVPVKTQKQSERLNLNIIRKDLIKTTIFALFAVGVLIAVKMFRY